MSEQTIQLRKNNTDKEAVPSSLLLGEVAVNLLDRSLFSYDGSEIIKLYTGAGKYFDASGNANNALKLGGYLPADFATSNDLDKYVAALQGGIDALWARNSFDELGVGHLYADTLSVGSILSGLPESLKNPYGLTFGSKTYDGSAPVTLTAGDLGALTSHQTIYDLTFQSGAFSAKTFDPNGAAQTVNIPTTTAHIAESGNLYFTNARALAAVQSQLDAKLNVATFEDLFEKVNVGTTASPVYAIKAKYSFFSVGEVSAYGSSDGSSSGGSGGLIQTVYGYSNLGGSFSDTTLTDTFNAYTINQIASRVASLEGGSALSFVTSGSGNVVTGISKIGTAVTVTKGLTALTAHQSIYALTIQKNGNNVGTYTPNSAAKTIDIAVPTTVAELSDAGNYLTGITSSMVVGALGYTPYNAVNFTKANIKSTLGISDWALAGTKPSYAFSEITDTPTVLAGYGITDAQRAVYLYNYNTYYADTTIHPNIIAYQSSSDMSKFWFYDTKYYQEQSETANRTQIAWGYKDYGMKQRYYANSAWSDWVTFLHSGNYNSYAPTLTGGGASGTWGISITGNAATATKSTQDGNGNVIATTYATASALSAHTSNMSNPHNVTKSQIGLGNVENTAISTWAGSSKITTVGTITSGTWNGTKIANAYLANSAITIAGTSVSLGGSISKDTLQANLGLGSFAYISSLAFSSLTSKPTTLSGYGITDAYTATAIDSKIDSYVTALQGGIDALWARNSFEELYAEHLAADTIAGASIFGDTVNTGSVIAGGVTVGGSTVNNGTYALYVTGSAYVTSGIVSGAEITAYSQRSLKNVLDERGLSLEELKAIKPTRYTWKDGRDERVHVGGIADDVQTVLPEVVYEHGGLLTMDYGNASFAVAASLIKPVTEHEEKIAMLERRIEELEEEVKQLKKV